MNKYNIEKKDSESKKSEDSTNPHLNKKKHESALFKMLDKNTGNGVIEENINEKSEKEEFSNSSSSENSVDYNSDDIGGFRGEIRIPLNANFDISEKDSDDSMFLYHSSSSDTDYSSNSENGDEIEDDDDEESSSISIYSNIEEEEGNVQFLSGYKNSNKDFLLGGEDEINLPEISKEKEFTLKDYQLIQLEFQSKFAIKFLLVSEKYYVVIDNFNIVYILNSNTEILTNAKLNNYNITGSFEFMNNIYLYSNSSSFIYELIIDSKIPKIDFIPVKGKAKNIRSVIVSQSKDQLFLLGDELCLFDKYFISQGKCNLGLIDIKCPVNKNSSNIIIGLNSEGNIIEISTKDLSIIKVHSFDDRVFYKRIFLWNDNPVIIADNFMKIFSPDFIVKKEVKSSISNDILIGTLNNNLIFIGPNDVDLRVIDGDFKISQFKLLEKMRFSSISYLLSNGGNSKFYICYGKNIFTLK